VPGPELAAQSLRTDVALADPRKARSSAARRLVHELQLRQASAACARYTTGRLKQKSNKFRDNIPPDVNCD
jgi:hypothetical protein